MLDTTNNGSVLQMPEQPGVAADLHWYALSTRSRHEKQVRDRLAAVGIEPFLPLTRLRSQWSDRRVWTESPLFPSYCFARFSPISKLRILQIPGIVRIVGITTPEAISDEEIAALKQLAESERPIQSHSYFTEGAMVQVVRGPLAGLRGQLLRKAGQHSLVIRVHLIQQAATVHIDAEEVVSAQ
ncbi:MAG: UpxY family transcription antiterminator [Nitrospira sp.]|nr:MAG: UpxY family transcription antiterminator [Nitrospira sp.]